MIVAAVNDLSYRFVIPPDLVLRLGLRHTRLANNLDTRLLAVDRL